VAKEGHHEIIEGTLPLDWSRRPTRSVLDYKTNRRTRDSLLGRDGLDRRDLDSPLVVDRHQIVVILEGEVAGRVSKQGIEGFGVDGIIERDRELERVNAFRVGDGLDDLVAQRVVDCLLPNAQCRWA
jgi:hypothetical protein